MAIPPKKSDRVFSYADYLTWPQDESWELIEGFAFNMSPAPGREHQKISGNLFFHIRGFLEGKTCEIYAAPFDVRFPKDKNQANEEILSVVQPDLSVICDADKLDEKGCKGAPDFVIEILSPHTMEKDFKYKLLLYEKHGVPEYWVVNPVGSIVMVYKLNEQKKYGREEVFGKSDIIPLKLKDGEIKINLEKVFPGPAG
ncbi:MAG: Uma2 family endonuclease [bacterium]|nr:Uma2 family endonuclease [bacterium]